MLILCVCGLQSVYSQTHDELMPLSLETVDSMTLEPIVGVTCRIYSDAGKLYDYGISDTKGNIKLKSHKNDWLEFSFLGYEKKKVKASQYNTSKKNIVYMLPGAVKLKEIQIKAPPISARNDTLVYRVSAFTKAGDRHLDDVLKRLPGVKVSENGTVSVQGKSINKFYVEGMDLVGNDYNQITKNMPIDAVTSIEVLENHQPVKLLYGKQFSDKAAINIRIDKEHKSRPFGELEGGLGLLPTKWDNRVFITHIADKSQLLLSGKMNNTGNDLSEEITEHIDVSDLEAYEPIPSPLLNTDLMQETLSKDHYIFNKSYAGGINILRKLSANSTLRLNTQLYEDHSSRSNNTLYNYGGSMPLTLIEDVNMKGKNFSVIPIIKYEHNSERSYISDEIRVNISRKSAATSILSNASSIKEEIKSRPSYLRNYFSSSFPIGNKLIQLKSLIRYFNRKESLEDYSESTNLYNGLDNYAFKSFVSKNLISTKFVLLRNYLDVGIKTYYRDNHYDFEGEMRHRNIKVTFLPSYYIKYGRRSGLSISLPIGWNYAKLSSTNTVDNSRAFYSFSPALSLNHYFTDAFSVRLSASLNTGNEDIPFYSNYPLRLGYRTICAPDDNLYKRSDYLLSLGLKYRDLASMFFSNLSISYTNAKHENYLHYDYLDSLTTIYRIKGDNRSKMLIIDGMVDKSFVDIGLSLKSEITYTQNSYLLSQDEDLVNNRSNILSASVSTSFQKLKWFRLVVDAIGSLYWERNSIQNSETLTSFKTNASLYIFPFKGLEIKIKGQSIINEISSSQYKNMTFLYADMCYKINKTWELGIKATNILDTELYEITQNSGLNRIVTSLPLRGREVLLNLLLRI